MARYGCDTLRGLLLKSIFRIPVVGLENQNDYEILTCDYVYLALPD